MVECEPVSYLQRTLSHQRQLLPPSRQQTEALAAPVCRPDGLPPQHFEAEGSGRLPALGQHPWEAATVRLGLQVPLQHVQNPRTRERRHRNVRRKEIPPHDRPVPEQHLYR